MGRSVVIVCEAGTDWLTDDGVRLMPESREDWISFHRLFCCCLDDLGLKYKILRYDVTSIEERVAFVLGTWESAHQSDELKELQGNLRLI